MDDPSQENLKIMKLEFELLKELFKNKGSYCKPNEALINDEMDFSGEKTSPRHRSKTYGTPLNMMRTMTDSERHASSK